MSLRVIHDDRDRALRLALGRAIRGARDRAGITQAELGRLVGVAENTVWRWETGHTTMSVSSVYAVARALGVSVLKLFPKDDG